MVLTATLILVTAFYAYQTQRTVEIASEANRLNFRPYLAIKGASPITLARLALDQSSKKDLKSDYGANEDVFSLAKSPDGTNYIIYSIENIGNVPARSVQNVITIDEINKSTGAREQLPVAVPTNEDLVYPHKTIDKIIPIGKDVAYKKTDGNIFLEITIKINFRGDKKEDQNNYFSIRKFSYKVVESITPPQQLETIFQDEGVDE